MSILIKGMKMPTSCLSCPLQGGTADCRLTQKTYNWGLTERPSDCPLVLVTPHGRLIDADAFFKDVCNSIENMTKLGVCVDADFLWAKLNDALDNAPTVIPADKDGE